MFGKNRGVVGFLAMVRDSRKGLSDFLISLIPHASQVAAGFAGSVLVARGLGPAGLGQYALITSFSQVVASLSDIGVGQTALRYASQAAAQDDEARQFSVLRWAFRNRLFLAAVCTSVAYCIVPYMAGRFWHVPELVPLLRWGLGASLASVVSGIPMIYLQSMRCFRHYAVARSGQSLLMLGGLMVLAMVGKWSVSVVVLVTVLTAWLGTLPFLLMVPRTALLAWPEPMPNPTTVLRLFGGSHRYSAAADSLDETDAAQFAFFSFLSGVVVLVLTNIDVWLIGAILGDTQVGIYSAASRFVIPLTVVLGAFNTALWPRVSTVKDYREISDLLRKITRGSLILALGAVAYTLSVPRLAPILFGENYAQSVSLAMLLCTQRCFSMVLAPLGLLGYSLGLVKWYVVVNCAQLALIGVLNLTLLPLFGPGGSAIALIASDAVGLAATVWLVRSRLAGLRCSEAAKHDQGCLSGHPENYTV